MIESTHKSDFSCATCSELPSNMSTMVEVEYLPYSIKLLHSHHFVHFISFL